MAPRALESLRQDHRYMQKLLDLLGRQINLVAEDREPDSEILFEIADYFRSYPDLYHHPKEDLIAHMLMARLPAAADELGGLDAEHEEGSHELIRFCHSLVDFSMDPEKAREPFLAAARAFHDHERRHMAWEEERFFATAEHALLNEDWAEIDARLARLKVPDYNNDMRARFSALSRELGRWRGNSAA